MKEVTSPMDRLLGSGTATLHWLLMLYSILYQASQISPHDVYRIKLLIWVWMVFWKQSATYLHNWSLLLLMSATVVACRSFQVGWWNIIKLRIQWRRFFYKFLLIETRNTRLLWKIWLSWSVNELHPGLFIHGEMNSTGCSTSAAYLQSFKYFFNFFGSCPYLRYV